MSFRLALLLAAVSCGIFGLAFPPQRLRLLAFVALVPCLVALRGCRTTGRAALLGALTGVGAAWSVGQWFAPSMARYYEQPLAVGSAAFLAVALVMVSPYYALFAALYHRIAERRSCVSAPLFAAAAWAGSDLLRGRLFTGTPFFIGNPWGLLGYSQPAGSAIAQVADLGGVYAVSFAVAAANGGIAEALRRGLGRRRRLAAAAAGALPAALAILYGAFALALAAGPARTGTSVLLVQGNLPDEIRWDPSRRHRGFEIYAGLTRRGLAAADARLVVWPEAVLTVDLAHEPPWRAAVASLLAADGSELVLGTVGRQHAPAEGADPVAAPRFVNRVLAVDARGRILGHYDKRYLVPFAEYAPHPRLDLMRRDFGAVGRFHPGTQSAREGLLPTPAGLAGVLVCNEAMLPEVASAAVAAGAELLVNPSNDSWIRDRGFAEQQLDIARFRAVEQRRPLLRASTSGPSAVIDTRGRVLARTGPLERRVLEGRATPSKGRTLYGRIGDAFGAACLLAAVWGAGLVPRPGRRGP